MPFKQAVSLKKYNTFGLNEEAAFFASFTNLQECIALVAEAKAKQLPIKILGGGSNVLLTSNVQAAVLHNEIKGIKIISSTNEKTIVQCAAGEAWHRFVLWTLDNNLQGFENLSLIPGTVGAAPMQNIGAYGVEIKDFFFELNALHIESGEVHKFNKTQCAFGYRESVFKRKLAQQYVILDVRFELNKIPQFNTSYGAITDVLNEDGITEITARAISNAVIKIRQSKLPNPSDIGNAGSFFKNPEIAEAHYLKLKTTYENMPHYPTQANFVKVPAGWLIENCGWKGFREGDIGVHAKQALVLVNYGNAKGEDIYNLSGKIIDSVQQKFDITLEREVNIW
jgi:UDP-N-acetylmuramate dehydrogenase